MFILKQGDEDIFKLFLDEILEGFIGKSSDSINVLDVTEVTEFNRKSIQTLNKGILENSNGLVGRTQSVEEKIT